MGEEARGNIYIYIWLILSVVFFHLLQTSLAMAIRKTVLNTESLCLHYFREHNRVAGDSGVIKDGGIA